MKIENTFLIIAILRQIFASEKGKIGLFWLSNDFSNVIPSSTEALAENVEGQVEVPKNLVIMKGHKKAWTEFSKETIEENGGNPKLAGWRSLPRGFVGYSTEEERFCIVGGKWLNDSVGKMIASAFNIKDNNYSLMTFPDYDNIVWEEDW